MDDLFLSYAREDSEAAKRIANVLSARWSVFWDSKIRAGQNYPNLLLKKLKAAPCVVVLWSKVSVESRWVQDEAERARIQEKLIQVFIEETEPPLGQGMDQHISLVGGDTGDPDKMNQLIEAVSAMVKGSTQDTTPVMGSTSLTLPEWAAHGFEDSITLFVSTEHGIASSPDLELPSERQTTGGGLTISADGGDIVTSKDGYLLVDQIGPRGHLEGREAKYEFPDVHRVLAARLAPNLMNLHVLVTTSTGWEILELDSRRPETINSIESGNDSLRVAAAQPAMSSQGRPTPFVMIGEDGRIVSGPESFPPNAAENLRWIDVDATEGAQVSMFAGLTGTPGNPELHIIRHKLGEEAECRVLSAVGTCSVRVARLQCWTSEAPDAILILREKSVENRSWRNLDEVAE